jgi:hypothetical protein
MKSSPGADHAANTLQDTMTAALSMCGGSPEQVSYVEANGSGLATEDHLELECLKSVFGATERSSPLLLGSVKTNIGHLEAAAGVASLIKVVLALKNSQIPGSHGVQSTKLSPSVAQAGFVVLDSSTQWPSSQSQLVAVNSFGQSTAFSSVVVQAAPPRNIPSKTGASWLSKNVLALSAVSEEVMFQVVDAVDKMLQQCSAETDLSKISEQAMMIDFINTTWPQYPYKLSVVLSKDDVSTSFSHWRKSRAHPIEHDASSEKAFYCSGRPSSDTSVVIFFSDERWDSSLSLAEVRDLCASQKAFSDCFLRFSDDVGPLPFGKKDGGTSGGSWLSSASALMGTSGDSQQQRHITLIELLQQPPAEDAFAAAGSAALQTALQVAVHLSRYSMLIAAGVSPKAVAGKGTGLLAAAVASGALEATDAAHLAGGKISIDSLSGRFGHTSVPALGVKDWGRALSSVLTSTVSASVSAFDESVRQIRILAQGQFKNAVIVGLKGKATASTPAIPSIINDGMDSELLVCEVGSFFGVLARLYTLGGWRQLSREMDHKRSLTDERSAAVSFDLPLYPLWRKHCWIGEEISSVRFDFARDNLSTEPVVPQLDLANATPYVLELTRQLSSTILVQQVASASFLRKSMS